MVEWVTIGNARLACGDCLEILPSLGKVDAVVTDPPYGVDLGNSESARDPRRLGLKLVGYASYDDTFTNFKEVVVPAISAAIDKAPRAAVFCNHNIWELPKPVAFGGVFVPGGKGRHPWGFNCLAPIAFYGKSATVSRGAGFYPAAIASSETPEPADHPAMKPLGWMEWLVGLATSPGETILDPFMGSGTTGVACAKLGRKFIGIEIEPKYFDIACKRIEQAYAQPDMFIAAPPQPTQEVML